MEMASSFSSSWPDPNSPVLSKIDFGVPLPDLLLWLEVRDTFLGQNEKKQDITAALALSRDCRHPDAVWLASVLDGKDVSTAEQAKDVFLKIENDARALCFAYILTDEDDDEDNFSLLKMSVEMGNAFACSTLHEMVNDHEDEEDGFRVRLARKAVKLHERDGFFWLGVCYEDGIGCEVDMILAKENFLIAAELGHVWAADDLGRILDACNHDRWIWFSRAALHGWPESFLESFSDEVGNFFSGCGNATVVFLIGRALKGNINMDEKLFFGIGYDFLSLNGPANQAISFYEHQVKAARLAVDTWTMISIRLILIKDMRIFIAKMIWEKRFEAIYKI